MDINNLVCGAGGLADAAVIAAATPSLISRFVFWPYCAGVAYSAIGVFAARAQVAKERGLDKLLAFGSLCYAIPLAVFGAEHLARPLTIMKVVPVWMPWRLFWTYFVGVALLAAALSIALKRHVRLSATLLGIMFALFVLMMHIPGVFARPGDRFFWAIAFRDLSFAGGAFALAGMQTAKWRAGGRDVLVTLGRLFIGIAAIFCGVENLLHPAFAPGLPLRQITPGWVPGHLWWGYFAGAVLLVAGPCLLVNRRTRAAATYLGATTILLVLFVYLPPMIASPLSIVAVNYVFDSLLYAGAVLILANAAEKESDTARV
jgi:uncharacterized membrane protein